MAREAPQARSTAVEIRTRRKRDGDLGAAGSDSGLSWKRLWISLKEEQEKLKERVRECDGDDDGGGVLRNRLGELSHGGHMRSNGEEEREKGFEGSEEWRR